MDRSSAIAELPSPYAVAIRLRDSGADAETIATALALDAEEVSSVLDLAEAKLAALVERPD
jgi:DNA-directed RNA polymerase specialized sigma24 family protein